MTVEHIVYKDCYQGLSTDTKPTSPPDGSTYHSVDTGEVWVYFNDMWMIDLRISRAIQMAS